MEIVGSHCSVKRLWSSGRIPRCHRGDPGSIPGKRIFKPSIRSANKGVGHVEAKAIVVLDQILNVCLVRLTRHRRVTEGALRQVL